MECDLSDTDVISDMDCDLPDLDGPQVVSQPTRQIHCLSDSSDSDADEVNCKTAYIPLKERVLNCQNSNKSNKYQEFSDASDVEIVDYKASHDLTRSPVHVAISDDSNDSCVLRCYSPCSDNDLEHQPLSSLISKAPCTTTGPSVLTNKNVSHHVQGAEPGIQISGYSQLSESKTLLSTIPSMQNSRKRTADEIIERKRQAQMKRDEKEKQKFERQKSKDEKQAEKERAALIRNAERSRKKQYGLLKDCLSFMKIILDTHLVNDLGLGASIFKSCESLGVQCVAEPQTIPFTITWQRTVTECDVTEGKVDTWTRQTVEDNVLTLIPTSDFVHFVKSFKQMGEDQGQTTLKQYIKTIQQHYQGKHLTAVVLGMEKYFRDQKTAIQRKHKEVVRSMDQREPSRPKKTKTGETTSVVSRMEVEEAVIETQLQTGTMVHMMESNEEFAQMVKTFTKAVAEKPAKKDRLENVFSFHEDGTTGVRVDKSGHGLLKVWKQQLLQFKNISPDIADAVLAEYPSPWLLYKALMECTDETTASRLLENIVVRRGTGVLRTTRRIGKEMSRRIYLFLTSRNPDVIIK
ncbi:crossover junction endonuclease EME1-like isoform X2 [Mizuhopecten yessoensis]|uniref:crossover junction endonuclease EME1-like isoform X2 n=1 Tax=Mizuhopecten yessoensis TaxID=6573 RepID=UPI000B45B9DD|nr:crossover junction endonuclease EME1-like isoform X2 [Mizuhopecten yessoensis]